MFLNKNYPDYYSGYQSHFPLQITDQMASAYSQAGYGAYPGGYPGSPSYPPDRAYNAVLANFDEARRNEQHEVRGE